MDYEKLLLGMKRFGSTEKDVCKHGLGVPVDSIKENVILAPWWEPDVLPGLGKAELLSLANQLGIRVWNIEGVDFDMTFIRTGIGAPCLTEGLFPLGVTKCKRIIFIGSAGSLSADINIGDIVIPEFSVCGDGVSRYIADDLKRDVFGEKAYPDSFMFKKAVAATEGLCKEHNMNFHIGRTFSTDTIFAQFAHMDAITGMGCNTIEMETAAAFRAAEIMKIPLIALFSISDNIVKNKSLVSGRTAEELDYRKLVRSAFLPKIILAAFKETMN